MTTVKNEVFISLLHQSFYLVGRELIFGREEIIPGAWWMSKFLASCMMIPFPPVGKTLLIYMKYKMINMYIQNITIYNIYYTYI